jgi:soluble lytic murein transglycosylase-like protein
VLRLAFLVPGFTIALAGNTLAGNQIYEPLAAEVRAGLQASIADKPAPHAFSNSGAAVDWLTAMSQRLESRIPNFQSRVDFLRTLHFEATHAGLDPQLVLALIQIESSFRKYAVSRSGARGYMQVMPFWAGLIGRKGDNLFSLRTNLRYGCVILKHYLSLEKGDLIRALARYNGSQGKPEYPNLVIGAWRSVWRYEGRLAFAPPSPCGPARKVFGECQEEKTVSIVACMACAAARASGARRIGLPTTM